MPGDRGTNGNGGGRSLSEYVLPAVGLLPVAVAVGAVLDSVVPSPFGFVGGALAWFLMLGRLLDVDEGPDRSTPDPLLGGDERERIREANRAVDTARDGVDAAGGDAGVAGADPDEGGVPVARGILDRAERYLDHEAPDRARETADRAWRVAAGEAAVRSTLAEFGATRRYVDTVDRMEALLGEAEATAATEPERAEALVAEARELADDLGDDLRAAAADRAEAARSAGDPERARREYAAAYELADAAARLGLGEGSGSRGTGDPAAAWADGSSVDRGPDSTTGAAGSTGVDGDPTGSTGADGDPTGSTGADGNPAGHSEDPAGPLGEDDREREREQERES